MNKLSGRPFLIVEFFQRPHKDADTKIKGWMKNRENLETLERAFVVDRVKSSHRGPVIIDLVTGEVPRNGTNKPNDELVAHYIQKYETMIRESLSVWAQNQLNKQPKEEADV